MSLENPSIRNILFLVVILTVVGLIYTSLNGNAERNVSAKDTSDTEVLNSKKEKKGSFRHIKDKIAIGEQLNLEGNYTTADSLFGEVIVLSKTAGFLAGELLGNLGLGQSQYYLGKYDQALNSYRKAIAINDDLNRDSLSIRIYNGIGDVLYQQGQYDNSNAYFFRSVDIAQSIGDQVRLSKAYQKLGKNHRFQTLYEEALRYYLASAKIANETNNNELLAVLYNNLGLLHADQQEYTQAIEYYMKSIDLGDNVSDRTIILDTYFNLAGTYSDLREFDKALEYIDIVYQYDQETGYVWGQALDLNYIGTIHFRQGQYELAIEYYSESLKLFESIGAEGNYLDPMIRIATTFSELNQTDLARSYLQKALTYSRKTNILEYEVHAYEYLAQVEEKAKNFKAAYESHQLYKQLSDSLANQQEIKKIAKKEAQFEFQQERDSIDFVRETDLLAFNAEIEKKSTIQLLTSISLGIVLSLSLAIYFLYSQRTRSNKALRKSLAENRLLIKEIHHRVKNNLQIISSLLNIKSTFLKYDEAKQVVTDIQDRVISMSVVHQNLYTDEHVMEVRADTYLNKLIKSIKRTFEDPDDPVTVIFDVDPVRLQSDEAINIGLIINESITNALKHAFPEQTEHNKEIVLSLKEHKETIQLNICDNGLGMEKGQQEKMMFRYGWKMIESLIRSMKATVSISNDNGTTISIQIPINNAYA